MARYDRSYTRPYGAPLGGARREMGYDRGLRAGRGTARGRDVYGEEYPTFGGYPGAAGRGMYYGGYDRGYAPRRGFAGGGYAADFARETFMPEAAYRRHPEYDRPQTHRQNPWDYAGPRDLRGGEGMSDRELGQEVRSRLFQDSWLDAERIDVSASEGVVTLTGEVNDYMEARYAWDDAWETEGVRGVVNNLTVRTDVPHPDHGDPFPQAGGHEPGFRER